MQMQRKSTRWNYAVLLSILAIGNKTVYRWISMGARESYLLFCILTKKQLNSVQNQHIFITNGDTRIFADLVEMFTVSSVKA